MRLGCLGCLVLAVVLVAIGIVVGGGFIFYTSVFALPDTIPKEDWSAMDGSRAQQKLFEIALRESRESSRKDPVVFADKEVNAFLARHLVERAGIPVSPIIVRFHPGSVVIQGKTELKPLLRGIPFNYLADLIPRSTTIEPVWVVLRGTLRIDRRQAGRERSVLRIEPTGFRIGNLDTGTWFLSWVLGHDLLSWHVPSVIERIDLEEGRAVVVTART